MKDRVAKSVFWMVWSRGGVQVLSFVSTLYVARLLSPSDYGLMALSGIWTSTIALLAEMGLSAAIVQFRDLEEGEINACFWLTVGVATIGYFVLYAAAPFIAGWFVVPQLSDVLRVSGLSLIIVAARVVPDSLLRKSLALDKVSQAEIASVVVTIPVVIGMAMAGAGVWALVIGVLLMMLVQSLMTFWFVRWCPGLTVGGARLREVIRYSLAALGAKGGWAAFEQTDPFVLGKISGETVLGLYSMAKQLATLPLTKISVVVNQLTGPIMAELQGDRARMSSSFFRVLRLVGCLTFPLCTGMAIVADDLILVALTEKWLPIVPALRVLCICALIRSIEVLLPPVLLARYRAKFLFWWTVGLLLVMPLAFWAGAIQMGALGVALAWIVVYPFLIIWMVREALIELQLTWRDLWFQLAPIFGATLIMTCVVIATRYALPASNLLDTVVRLIVSSGLGAVTYGAAILWQGGLMVKDMAEVSGWIFGRALRTGG